MKLRAPFPWFGGKSLAAPLIWRAFGSGKNRGRERIWFSPHCLPTASDGELLADRSVPLGVRA